MVTRPGKCTVQCNSRLRFLARTRLWKTLLAAGFSFYFAVVLEAQGGTEFEQWQTFLYAANQADGVPETLCKLRILCNFVLGCLQFNVKSSEIFAAVFESGGSNEKSTWSSWSTRSRSISILGVFSWLRRSDCRCTWHLWLKCSFCFTVRLVRFRARNR